MVLPKDEIVLCKYVYSFNSNLIIAIVDDIDGYVTEDLFEDLLHIFCLDRYDEIFLSLIWIINKEFDTLLKFLNRLKKRSEEIGKLSPYPPMLVSCHLI